MSNNEYYSEYLNERAPIDFGSRMLAKWHRRLLNRASQDIGLVDGNSVLEIGAGHGYLAAAARERHISYEFVDLSSSVFEHMSILGFNGHLGDISVAPREMANYDAVWISHVLEHSPDWVNARQMIYEASERLSPGGRVVIISPDLLSSKREFWSSDWSHGYPTTRRNVVQLCSDVGLHVEVTRYHRGGYFNIFVMALFALVAAIPHIPIDACINPARRTRGEGFFYSWKTAFGWRQIYVIAKKKIS